MLKTVIIVAIVCICRTASEGCDQELSGNYGTIVSPGYPFTNYDDNLNCNYKITTSSETTIDIAIVEMHLEYDYDYLKIYDGPTNTSAVIGTYSGDQVGIHIYTTTNEALIYFHTDDSITEAGFYIYFQEIYYVVCPASDYTADYGVIQSPLYPDAYANAADCFYNFQTYYRTQITFHINTFDMELSENCSKDYFEIYDGSSVKDKSLGKLCGSGPFRDIISSSNLVLAYFHSDNATNGLGFNISYGINACPNAVEYRDDFGTIYSPGYPTSNYPTYSDCNYTVITPEGSQVLLYINYLHIEAEPANCGYDYLRIYDGPDDSYPQLAEFCGLNSTFGVQASTNKVLLQFHSDYSTTYEGFAITYTATYFYDDDNEEQD